MRSPLLLVLPAVAVLSGCVVFRHLAGRDTVDLEKADVRAMGVDIRKAQKTICPRERVQMAVFADVVLQGKEGLRKFETWEGGPNANRNGKLDFADFAFASDAGSFDPDGWFTPHPSLLATAAREMEITTAYRRRPDKFTFKTSYKPDYDCIKEQGKDGPPGIAGAPGSAGTRGTAGSTGATTTSYQPASTPGGMSHTTTQQGPGGNGGNGGPGGPGSNGTNGGAGPRFAVWVTFVKTPFYDKLVAAVIEGDVTDVLLFPPETVLQLHANGGRGGAGGPGGKGGEGGPGGSGNPPGSPGQKGADGRGGNGGNGGAGGSIEITFDARFAAELRAVLNAQANGGAPGPGGAGGGISGQLGAPGRVERLEGDVRERFAGFEGVTVL